MEEEHLDKFFSEDEDYSSLTEEPDTNAPEESEEVHLGDVRAKKEDVLYVRYELVARVRKDAPVMFVAPGQAIPVYRKKNGRWQQVLNSLEFRAYVLPVCHGKVWTLGAKRPSVETGRSLASQPPRRETLLSRPGGRYIVRPHPVIPSAIGMDPYPGPDLPYNLLDSFQMQAGDMFRHFKDHPVMSGSCPFRWVVSNSTPPAHQTNPFGLGGDADAWGYNPITGKRVENLHPVGIPIGWRFGHSVMENFCAFEYADATESLLEETGAEWLYISNSLSQWGHTTHLVEAPVTAASDLPKGILEMPWRFDPEGDKYGEESFSPLLYGELTRLSNGVCE